MKNEITIREVPSNKTVSAVASTKNNISSGIVPFQKSLRQIALKDWKAALQMAWNLENPNRVLLYDIYDNILIDSHLSSIVESRVLLILRSKFKLVNSKNGETDTEITKLFETKWFNRFLKYAIESVFWGYSLTELNDFFTEFPYINLISRRHVVPEFSYVKKEVYDDTGINYIEGLKPYYVGIGDTNELGILYKAAPLILAKKYALASWSEFNEKFGIPFRKVTTPSYDDKRTDQLGQIMQNMGSAGWAVLREGEVLDFHEVSAGSAVTTFDGLIDRLNKEVSKLILGQTATTEHGETGTYGSLKVMQEVAADRHESDKTFIKYIINNELIPRLVLHGYIKDGFTFKWDDKRELSTAEHIEMINKLNINYIIPVEYVTEKTGVPVLERERTQQIEVENVKKKLEFEVNLPPSKQLSGILKVYDSSITDLDKELLEQAWDEKAGTFNSKYFTALSSHYQKAISTTFGKRLENIEYHAYDHTVYTMLEANIFRFAAAKDVAVLTELNRMVRDNENYHEFKKQAGKLLKDFNTNWLQTEYNNALSTGLSASTYWDAVADKDLFPFWQYRTANDNRVRSSHEKLNNLYFKADEMGGVYPPNGWGCRCEVIKHDKLPKHAKISTKKDAENLLKATILNKKGDTEWDSMNKNGFNVNRAKIGTAFTESQMYVKNFNESKLGIKDMYGHERYKWDNIDKSKLPKIKTDLNNNKEAKEYLEKKKNKKGDIVYNDYNKRPIQIVKKTIKSHLSEKTKYKGRYKYVKSIDEILNKPDEVWLQGKGDSEKGYTYNYIKFYKEEVVVVIVEIMESELVKIKTFLNIDTGKDGSFRNGILIKKISKFGT